MSLVNNGERECRRKPVRVDITGFGAVAICQVSSQPMDAKAMGAFISSRQTKSNT